MKGKG